MANEHDPQIRKIDHGLFFPTEASLDQSTVPLTRPKRRRSSKRKPADAINIQPTIPENLNPDHGPLSQPEGINSVPALDGEKVDSASAGRRVTEDLEPIPVPLIERSILHSLKSFKVGGQATIVSDRVSRYLIGRGVDEEEVNKMKPKEALETVSANVEKDFKAYFEQLRFNTATILINAGLEPAFDFLSPLGEADKATPLETEEQIRTLLWNGSFNGEKEELEEQFRKLEREFLEANVRANGIMSLDEYFRLNDMFSLRVLNGIDPENLVDHFSSKLQENDPEEAKRALTVFYYKKHPQSNEVEYLQEVAEFKATVSSLSNKGDVDEFSETADIVDFIEKIKVVARDKSDYLLQIAEKTYEAAIAALNKSAGGKHLPDARPDKLTDPIFDKPAIAEPVKLLEKELKRPDPDKKPKRSLRDKIFFLNRGAKNKQPPTPLNGSRSPELICREYYDGNYRHWRGNIGLSILAAALASGAIATGAITVFDHFNDESHQAASTGNTIVLGNNVNNYGIVDNSTSESSTGADPDGLHGGQRHPQGGEDRGTTGEIKLSGDMNQDLAKLYLDNKSDEKIGDGIHIKAEEAGQFFRALGVSDNPERYETLFDSFVDQDPTTEVVDLNVADADIVAYDFRNEDIQLHKADQAGLATFSRDRTIDLELPEDNIKSKPASTTFLEEKPLVFAASRTAKTPKVHKTAFMGAAWANGVPVVDISSPILNRELVNNTKITNVLRSQESWSGFVRAFEAPMAIWQQRGTVMQEPESVINEGSQRGIPEETVAESQNQDPAQEEAKVEPIIRQQNAEMFTLVGSYPVLAGARRPEFNTWNWGKKRYSGINDDEEDNRPFWIAG